MDSNDVAFRLAAVGAFRQAFAAASPVVLEPHMLVEVRVPTEYQGAIMGDLNRRRGMILDSGGEDNEAVITAQVQPLILWRRLLTISKPRRIETTHPMHRVNVYVSKFAIRWSDGRVVVITCQAVLPTDSSAQGCRVVGCRVLHTCPFVGPRLLQPVSTCMVTMHPQPTRCMFAGAAERDVRI